MRDLLAEGRLRTLVTAVVVAALVGIPVAIAAPGSGDSSKLANASTAKQVKKLKRQVRKLKRSVNGLKDDVEDVSKQEGPAGPAGDPGAPGAPGATGATGADGTSVVARARLAGGNVVVPANSGANFNVPLTGDTFTQGANETMLAMMTVTYQAPAACDGGTTSVRTTANGVVDSPDNLGSIVAPPGTSQTRNSGADRFLPEPGVQTARDLAVLATNTCTTLGQNLTITDVKVNVVRYR